jgi:hypothetical protein
MTDYGDPTLWVPYEDETGEPVTLDERCYMIEVVFADDLYNKPAVIKGTLESLRLFREKEGLLGFVPRHWADGMHLHPHLFRRVMERVRNSARDRDDVVRIVDDELDRWRREHSGEAWPVVVTDEARWRWEVRELPIDEYWLTTKRWS